MNVARCTLIASATLLTMLCTQAQAASRTWTDVYGHTIQAELVENLNGAVTLLRENGKEAHIRISELSATDQKYVLANSPPNIDISVIEITNRENQGFSYEDENDSSADTDYQIQTTDSRYKCRLNKSGTIPYNDSIQAELYVFGVSMQENSFILLSKTVKEFKFGQFDDPNQFSFESDSVTTRDLQGNRVAGTSYFGNMVVLVDRKGRVFEIKGSRSKMQEFTGLIRKMETGQIVTRAELQSAQNMAH